ncbi:MAG: hypothetical protein JWM11_836 [Planctomycetaceae bacterium]|nr:hypothetical protein [Planctomycetaceae bacterium]
MDEQSKIQADKLQRKASVWTMRGNGLIMIVSGGYVFAMSKSGINGTIIVLSGMALICFSFTVTANRKRDEP